VVSSLGALGPKTFGKIRRLSGGANKQKVSITLKRMVIAALKGTRMCWLKQNNWWCEPTGKEDQFLERQLNDVVIRYQEDEIIFDNEDRGIAEMAHETLRTELMNNDVAEKEEVELNQRAENENDYDDIMGFPPEDIPYVDWIKKVTDEIREGVSFMVATEEQLSEYDLGFGKDEAEEGMEKMTSSDDEEVFTVRSWSDGVWIVTPSESDHQRFWPHSE
jgi:hypothetical protein